MGVFGNSNSLPISLVLSLSKTLKGLHWDQVPGDNDDEVAARGILYLLIFQQLGQLLRWSWGYNVLLKPPHEYEDDHAIEDGNQNPTHLIEEGRYRDDPEEEEAHDILKKGNTSDYASGSSGAHSPETVSSSSSSVHDQAMKGEVLPTPANGNIVGKGPGNMGGQQAPSRETLRRRPTDHMTQFPSYHSLAPQRTNDSATGAKGYLYHLQETLRQRTRKANTALATFFHNLFRRFPTPMQKVLSTVGNYSYRFLDAIYQNMNPPLWAMLAAVIVASVPALQHLFFDKGTFVNNSVSRAIAQSGGVAVPLILVVLGANLARNTLPRDELATTADEKKEESKLLYASLISRMLLPTLCMAPFLALFAKFVPVSILDDPIFIIVCFLLTGAPSALQLAQICQINNVFMGTMSRLLFQSYVIWYVCPKGTHFALVLILVSGSCLALSSSSCLLWRWSNGLKQFDSLVTDFTIDDLL